MIKLLLVCVMLFSFTLLQAQSSTCYVLIKVNKGDKWYCPKQEESYEIHTVSKKLDSSKKEKVLDVFKKRFKAGDEKSSIKQEAVYMDKNDYLVIYEYLYKYSDKIDENCTTNIAKKIKGFTVSSLKDISKKLAKKLETNFMKDKYLSHKIIAIHQPFVIKDAGNLSTSTKILLQLLEKHKDSLNKHNNSATVGVRG